MGYRRAIFIIGLTPTLLCILPRIFEVSAHLEHGASEVGTGETVSVPWMFEGMSMLPEMIFCLVPTTFLGFLLALTVEATAN